MEDKNKKNEAFEGFTLEEIKVSCSTCMGKEGTLEKKEENRHTKMSNK